MVVIRCAIREFLYSRHTLLYLHCVLVSQFLLSNQLSNPSAITLTDIFSACWLRGTRTPERTRWVLTFESNGFTVLFPGGIISPLELRPLGQHRTRSHGYWSKHFASVSLGIIVSGATLICTWVPGTYKAWMWEKQHHIPLWFRRHESREQWPSLAGYYQVSSIVTEFSKAIPPLI